MMLEIDIQKTLRAGARHFQLDVRLQTNSQRLVIFGPSGAGKSLTLRAIAGLTTPDSGRICINDTVLFDHTAGIDLTPQARRMGYLFQDYALFPHLTVRQNIAFALAPGLRNPGRKFAHERVDYWLAAFQLEVLAHQYPHELSGGQRQRTALARALVVQPRALLLDEPFAALDPLLRTTLRLELDKLQRELAVPMILITHDPDDVAIFGEHVVSLREGRIADFCDLPQAAATL